MQAVTTPAAGIVRQHFDAEDRCLECGRILAVAPNYPAGRIEWRCVNRRCRLSFAHGAKPVRVPTVAELGWA
jgi:hypothetical protein